MKSPIAIVSFATYRAYVRAGLIQPQAAKKLLPAEEVDRLVAEGKKYREESA